MTALLDVPLRTTPLRFPVVQAVASFKLPMSREAFNEFVLQNSDWKIERDAEGLINVAPHLTLDSGYIEGEVFGRLANWASEHRQLGRSFSPSTSFELPDGAQFKADGAWISTEKFNALSPEERKRIARVVPDFVIEVRSESDRLPVLKKKMHDGWMANGVQLAWLIDPLKKNAWVYRAGSTAPEEIADFTATLSGEGVLPGFQLVLSELETD